MNATAYWFVSSLAGAFFLVAAAREKIRRGVHVLGLGAVLLAFLWPIVLLNRPLNMDEGHMRSGTSTLAGFGKYWGWADCTTYGPLIEYPLALPGLPGFDLDDTIARLFGLALAWPGKTGWRFSARCFWRCAGWRGASLPRSRFCFLRPAGARGPTS